MEFIKVYDKELRSGISGSVKKLTYNMCKSSNGGNITYGIQLKTEINREESYHIIEDISTDMGLVLKIIDCLSQNGVDDICFEDVVRDLIVEA